MLKQHSAELTDRLNELTQEVRQLAGENFNLDSPKQLQTILYDKMALPVLKKTPGGQPSTAEAVLVDLARDYELPKMILTYRSLYKLKSTYADKLPLDIQPATGRIHTRIIRQWQRRAGYLLPTPTRRTFPFATLRAGVYAKLCRPAGARYFGC